jgi:TonB family protein
MYEDDNDISYKPTEFLGKDDDDLLHTPQRSGVGILVFFIIFSLAALGGGLYIYITKTEEIKALKLELQNAKNEASGRAKSDGDTIATLRSSLKEAQQNVRDLGLKGEQSNQELIKRRRALREAEAKIEELQAQVKSSDNIIKNTRDELSTTRNKLNRLQSDYEAYKNDVQKRISTLEDERKKLRTDVSYWKKKYDRLSKEQTEAVNSIIASAKQRQKYIDDLETSLYEALKNASLYYSLIGWEENYRLTKRVPLTKLTQRPRLLTSSKPRYPLAVKQAGIEGIVIIKGIISEDGQVENIEVLYTPENNRDLADAARAAVAGYRYRPAMRNGEKVKVTLVIPVQFSLE